MSGRAAAALAVAALLGGAALPLRAQHTALTVTGLPASFAAPTGADFSLGYVVYPANTTYTIGGKNWAAGQTATETVTIRCSAPCPVSGPKAPATLQWKLLGDATWHTLTTAYVTVEVVTLTATVARDDPTWSNTIQWRFLLDWTSDPPGALTTFTINLQLTQV